jgi:hypothetical protein
MAVMLRLLTCQEVEQVILLVVVEQVDFLLQVTKHVMQGGLEVLAALSLIPLLPP